jgi:TonB family protein
MSPGVIDTHVREEGYRGAFTVSAVGHLLLFLFLLFASELLPRGAPLVIGSGEGGGQGDDFVTVGLSAELSGGTGMYKPALTPRPEAVAVPEPSKPDPPSPQKEESVFVDKAPRRETPETSPASPAKSQASTENSRPKPIPREPEPGSGGPGGQTLGSGGGFGGGQGVTIGTGTGEGAMDSWYVRQVEQRIGQNWLKTSLGQLENPVRTVISFEIRADGRIDNVRIEQRSGISSVDLAAERAVRASDPLSPLPYELRSRTVKFVAYFEYPPGG